jgi:hypothetical protein
VLYAASTVTVSEVEKSGVNQGSMLVTLSTSDNPTAFEMDLLFDPRRVEVLSPVSPQFPGASADDYRLDSNLVAPGHPACGVEQLQTEAARGWYFNARACACGERGGPVRATTCR